MVSYCCWTILKDRLHRLRWPIQVRRSWDPVPDIDDHGATCCSSCRDCYPFGRFPKRCVCCCPIWTLVRYWRWFVRNCTEASPCKGLCKLVKRLTRSPSSRTTIAAAGAFVGVDRVDPVRRFGRSQSVKIVEAAAAVTVICGRSSRRFSTSPPVTAADVVLLIRVTISRPARPVRAGPRPGGHPRLWLKGLKSTLLVVSVPTALCESSTSAFLYFPRTVARILLHLLPVVVFKKERKFFVLLVSFANNQTNRTSTLRASKRFSQWISHSRAHEWITIQDFYSVCCYFLGEPLRGGSSPRRDVCLSSAPGWAP